MPDGLFYRWATGRHVNINSYCLTPQHIVSATFLPQGHAVHRILAAASDEGHLQDTNPDRRLKLWTDWSLLNMRLLLKILYQKGEWNSTMLFVVKTMAPRNKGFYCSQNIVLQFSYFIILSRNADIVCTWWAIYKFSPFHTSRIGAYGILLRRFQYRSWLYWG